MFGSSADRLTRVTTQGILQWNEDAIKFVSLIKQKQQ